MTIGALNSYGNIQQYPCTGKNNLQKINQKPKPKKKEWSTRKKITTGLALLAFSAAFGIPLYLAIKKPNSAIDKALNVTSEIVEDIGLCLIG